MIHKKQTNSKYLLIGILIFTSRLIAAQTVELLNIDSCYAMAERNYPMVKQRSLLKETKEYSIANAAKGYLPQIKIAGQATYQSDVTSLPISIPNMTVPEVSKDQYKLYTELNQPITDIFIIKDQKELIAANMDIEEQKVEVELYKLKERINQLFFGILLLNGQIAQTALVQKDIQTAIAKTNAAIKNGIALKSSFNILQAELLKVTQKSIELKANKKGFTDMLSLFINIQITDSTRFENPISPIASPAINRPELSLFSFQKTALGIQRKLISVQNIPHLNFFFQAGYGRPALNMLSDDVEGYYITGLRLNWNLSGLYTFKKEKQINTLNERMIDVQQEIFLFNTSTALKQQHSEIEKLHELLSIDDAIIELRVAVKNSAKNQLANGTATSSEYLTQLNAEDQAKQTKLLHQIQLLLAEYNYKTTSGN